MRSVLNNATVLTGTRTLENCSVIIEDGYIQDVIQNASSEVTSDNNSVDIEGRRLIPGFVDIQVNGGGGVLFNNEPTIEAVRRVADAHLPFGTTAILPTLISDDYEVMRSAVAAVRQAITEGVPGIIGIHLEGPFLNSRRKGAHDETKFRALDDEAVEIMTSLGGVGATLVTLAPEQTSMDRIRQLVKAGVVVFAGHTAATFEECVAAEQAGLSGYTHLFNAMTPFSSREPGVVGAALNSVSSVFSIIADGHHIHPVTFKTACSCKKRGGAILVTDAMPTVGASKTEFELNGELIQLKDGVLRNAAGSLAGSNLTMIEAVRNAQKFASLEWQEAVRMASLYPARAIGVEGSRGDIKTGHIADFVEIDGDFNIIRVWRNGVAYGVGPFTKCR